MSEPTCKTCGELGRSHYAMQKGGRENEATYLPTAFWSLKGVRDLPPEDGRERQLMQCPHCHSFYLYEKDYEFLVSGSEDEEWLTRLAAADGERMLAL